MLSSFSGDSLKGSENDGEANNVLIAINRIKNFIRYIRAKIRAAVEKIREQKNKIFSKETFPLLKRNGIELDNLTSYKSVENLNNINQDENKEEIPKDYIDCFPNSFNKRLLGLRFYRELNKSKFMNMWTVLRKYAFKLAEHDYFETFIIIMIVLSSAALVKLFGLSIII